MEDGDGALRREQDLLAVDREDLREIVRLRFGGVPADVEEGIAKLQDISESSRLVLIAANAPDLESFRKELFAKIPAFRIMSDAFETRGDPRR